MINLMLVERNLWASVLSQAIVDLSPKESYSKNEARLQEEARLKENALKWFEEDKRKFSSELCDIEGCDPQIGSFMWICMVLGLEPDRMREAILG